MKALRIGILGDFNEVNPTHLATNYGLQHAAAALEIKVEASWLATDEAHDLAIFDALFCSPGSPYRSLEGALNGIRFARENNVPLIGTCGGFQHIILEYARSVMHVEDAAHAETDPYASRLVIAPLSCSLVGKTMEVHFAPGTLAAQAYGAAAAEENFYCNFGLNPEYEPQLEEAGLRITARDQFGEARVVELPSHPFYVGTLFVPQTRSTAEKPHPLLVAYLRAATSRS